MSRVYLNAKSNGLNVSGTPPGGDGVLRADTEVAQEYQEFEIAHRDADGDVVPIDFDKLLADVAKLLAHKPPDPPPHTSGDEMDLSKAVITAGSPDVRTWPIGATWTGFRLGYRVEDEDWNFTKRNGAQAWPFVEGMEGGDLQYTIWHGSNINGIWYFAGCINCISRGVDDNYAPTGGTLNPGQLPGNWYYHAGEPLASYQPKPGELTAWFLTSGSQRRGDIRHKNPDGTLFTERTPVIVRPFA